MTGINYNNMCLCDCHKVWSIGDAEMMRRMTEEFSKCNCCGQLNKHIGEYKPFPISSYEILKSNKEGNIKVTFKEGNMPVTFNFGRALEILKSGGRVSRTGWNGEDMYVELQFPELGHDRMTLPYAFMRTAQGEFVPWLASQTDILSDDWFKVN